ncbi:uncharacterized protein FOMMEDRAFT_152662 [Fomitiporia mediterranea MF3/22]|uniref:uncharacterized protein n=1 Tax=Fomitiporia mediterranea (strain MF3/22) TaxID=694068 RepID=UPI0004407C30|nr:uncharacterized protein FOMMEDRAFT_152662 [Fomitiporia mediterranea MF3/22]EJD05364.1 hypothetical protein FOMMEDRAFT_152662 [Fomitiporia mediterranea MF3/22]
MRSPFSRNTGFFLAGPAPAVTLPGLLTGEADQSVAKSGCKMKLLLRRIDSRGNLRYRFDFLAMPVAGSTLFGVMFVGRRSNYVLDEHGG